MRRNAIRVAAALIAALSLLSLDACKSTTAVEAPGKEPHAPSQQA